MRILLCQIVALTFLASQSLAQDGFDGMSFNETVGLSDGFFATTPSVQTTNANPLWASPPDTYEQTDKFVSAYGLQRRWNTDALSNLSDTEAKELGSLIARRGMLSEGEKRILDDYLKDTAVPTIIIVKPDIPGFPSIPSTVPTPINTGLIACKNTRPTKYLPSFCAFMPEEPKVEKCKCD